ncbi:MAG: hypothetical protein DMD91_04720 [Candidatus Rokuibacteriota bacterium]|nr:MAG: hypothetical protein DMD91_04720 [Candidatus Rokubacteria bacterium]
MHLAPRLAALGLFALVATSCVTVPSPPEAVSPDKPAPQEIAPREPAPAPAPRYRPTPMRTASQDLLVQPTS